MINAFEPITLGGTDIANRFAMAPMTRDRVGSGDTATPVMAEYQRQRASAGPIATETIHPGRLAQSLLGQTTDQEELHGNA